MATVNDDDQCPGCTHSLREEHSLEFGCIEGWTYPDGGGPALTEGCECPLTLSSDNGGVR